MIARALNRTIPAVVSVGMILALLSALTIVALTEADVIGW